jgi:hypothetical protein
VKKYWGKCPKRRKKHKRVDIKISKISSEIVLSINKFPKDIDVLAHMLSSRNTSSGRRVFGSSNKQGGSFQNYEEELEHQ